MLLEPVLSGPGYDWSRYPAMETHCWELAWDQMTSDLLGFPAESLCLVLQSRGMDLVEILSFLFQLSFSTLGRVSAPLLVLSMVEAEPGFWSWCWIMALLFQDYSVEGMSASLLTFLQHLREFGLVFQRKVRPYQVNFSGPSTHKWAWWRVWCSDEVAAFTPG